MENENQDQIEYRDTKDQSSKRDSHNKIESNVKQALKEQKIPFELKTSKKITDTSKRIGSGVGIINLPKGFDEEFDKMDGEIAELFENEGNL